MIECLTYRIGDHTTADDAKRYRSEEEVEIWRKRDPILRLEKYMLKEKMLTAKEKEKIWADADSRVEEAVKEFELMSRPKPEDMFRFVYARMPPELEEQYNEATGIAITEKPAETKQESKDEDEQETDDSDDTDDIVHAQ
jgi:pyruvate dehydrogenase E1 component alpha subunit